MKEYNADDEKQKMVMNGDLSLGDEVIEVYVIWWILFIYV
jgi:hypothetical protein